MPAYNRNRVSEEFRELADLADAAFRANLRNLQADPAAMRAHDEMLARANVYGYLYDRHFLHSPELLLNELRWLRATRRPPTPRNALHPERFVEHRLALLDLLINRFQNIVDYRDSLGAPEPSPPPPDANRAHGGKTTQQRALGETVRQSTDPGKLPD